MKQSMITMLDRMREKIKIFRKHEEREEAIEKGEIKSEATPEQRKELYELQLKMDAEFDKIEDMFKGLK